MSSASKTHSPGTPFTMVRMDGVLTDVIRLVVNVNSCPLRMEMPGCISTEDPGQPSSHPPRVDGLGGPPRVSLVRLVVPETQNE